MIAGAMIGQPKKVATRLGTFGELLYAVAPKASDRILNRLTDCSPSRRRQRARARRHPTKRPRPRPLPSRT